MANIVPIAGGMFGLEALGFFEKNLPAFLEEPCLKMINGRSCLFTLVDLLRPQTIWVPAYCCGSLLTAISSAKGKIKFYSVGEDLRARNLKWTSEVNQNDLVIFIDYFGFDLNHEAMSAIKNRGAKILQDAAQSLLSNFDRSYADFILYSPRKTVGVPCGGILRSQCDETFKKVELQNYPAEPYISQLSAFLKHTCFDKGWQVDWFRAYQEAEKLQPCGKFDMDHLTLAILSNYINRKEIAVTRRENYKQLLKHISDLAIFKKLPDCVVPLGFPVSLTNRNKIREQLYLIDVFCPIHWPTEGYIPSEFSESHHLANKILTIPCDQRLDSQKIEGIVSTIRRAL